MPAARLFDEMLKLLLSGHASACLQRLRNEGLHHGMLPLLDVILDQPLGERFVTLALAQTDERIRTDRPVSPAFLFAALLWHEVLAAWKAREAKGEQPAIRRCIGAMDEVLDAQTDKLAIPRRLTATMKEIWALQPRFEQRSGQRPLRLLEHPRFRAAYDFLRCAPRAAKCRRNSSTGGAASRTPSRRARRHAAARRRAGEKTKRRRAAAAARAPTTRLRRTCRRRRSPTDGGRDAVHTSGLGANLGDPAAQVRGAIAALGRTARHARWSPRRPLSQRAGRLRRPARFRQRGGAAVDTRSRAARPARRAAGHRARRTAASAPSRNAPRTLDLDLLLYGDAALRANRR